MEASVGASPAVATVVVVLSVDDSFESLLQAAAKIAITAIRAMLAPI